MFAQRFIPFVSILALCVGTATASAADKETSSVEGVVTFKGKALPEGKLAFHPEKGKPVVAEIKDGDYRIKSVPAGKYRVTVTSKLIPPKYGSPDTSGITFEVSKGKMVFDLELK